MSYSYSYPQPHAQAYYIPTVAGHTTAAPPPPPPPPPPAPPGYASFPQFGPPPFPGSHHGYPAFGEWQTGYESAHGHGHGHGFERPEFGFGGRGGHGIGRGGRSGHGHGPQGRERHGGHEFSDRRHRERDQEPHHHRHEGHGHRGEDRGPHHRHAYERKISDSESESESDSTSSESGDLSAEEAAILAKLEAIRAKKAVSGAPKRHATSTSATDKREKHQQQAALRAHEAARSIREQSREVARAAAEQAKEAERAARETAREAERAAKEIAREAERNAKEAQRAAEEQAREGERSAREAAKAARHNERERRRSARWASPEVHAHTQQGQTENQSGIPGPRSSACPPFGPFGFGGMGPFGGRGGPFGPFGHGSHPGFPHHRGPPHGQREFPPSHSAPPPPHFEAGRHNHQRGPPGSDFFPELQRLLGVPVVVTSATEDPEVPALPEIVTPRPSVPAGPRRNPLPQMISGFINQAIQVGQAQACAAIERERQKRLQAINAMIPQQSVHSHAAQSSEQKAIPVTFTIEPAQAVQQNSEAIPTRTIEEIQAQAEQRGKEVEALEKAEQREKEWEELVQRFEGRAQSPTREPVVVSPSAATATDRAEALAAVPVEEPKSDASHTASEIASITALLGPRVGQTVSNIIESRAKDTPVDLASLVGLVGEMVAGGESAQESNSNPAAAHDRSDDTPQLNNLEDLMNHFLPSSDNDLGAFLRATVAQATGKSSLAASGAPAASAASSSGFKAETLAPAGGKQANGKGKEVAEGEKQKAGDFPHIRFVGPFNTCPAVSATQLAPASNATPASTPAPAATSAADVTKTTSEGSETDESPIQAQYRARLDRSRKIEKLSSLQKKLDDVTEAFSFPETLDFSAPSSAPSSPFLDPVDSGLADAEHSHIRTPSLTFSHHNQAYHAHAHALLQLLTLADAVESDGDEEIRKVRKDFVKSIEAKLAEMEHRRGEIYRAQHADSEELVETAVPMADDSESTAAKETESISPSAEESEAQASVPGYKIEEDVEVEQQNQQVAESDRKDIQESSPVQAGPSSSESVHITPAEPEEASASAPTSDPSDLTADKTVDQSLQATVEDGDDFELL